MTALIALMVLVVAIPWSTSAQSQIGEVRVLGVAGWALRPGDAHRPAGDIALPGARAMVGGRAGLSFIAGHLSAGPEVSWLLGSDRRLVSFGAVGRLSLTPGPVRPYVLLGGGYDVWRRKVAFPENQAPVWTDDTNYLSGNLGGGVVFGTRRVNAVIEARAHKSLERVDYYGSRDLVTLSAGVSFQW